MKLSFSEGDWLRLRSRVHAHYEQLTTLLGDIRPGERLTLPAEIRGMIVKSFCQLEFEFRMWATSYPEGRYGVDLPAEYGRFALLYQMWKARAYSAMVRLLPHLKLPDGSGVFNLVDMDAGESSINEVLDRWLAQVIPSIAEQQLYAHSNDEVMCDGHSIRISDIPTLCATNMAAYQALRKELEERLGTALVRSTRAIYEEGQLAALASAS